MALHIVVLHPQQSGRIDANLANRISEIVSDGRPTLVCINQMTRNLDWWHTAQETQKQCELLVSNIRDTAKANGRTCGAVTVFFTDFAPVLSDARDQQEIQKIADMMHKRDFKSVEAVSSSRRGNWAFGVRLLQTHNQCT